MKKYLNKGLLYEWFNAAKVPILLGLITWGFIAHSILMSSIHQIKYDIAYTQSSAFSAAALDEYFILGVIFLAIYIFASGINKRNTTMFLCSGPYTKKQIKVNELICLLITLGLFIIMYLYIALTIYIRYNEFLFIVSGFSQVIIIEIIRIVLFGIIGILLMLILDLLFSNSIMAYLGMIGLLISTLFIWAKTNDILGYFGLYWWRVTSNIFGRMEDGRRISGSILFYGGNYQNNEGWMIAKGIVFLALLIGIMGILFNICEKRAKLETGSKIFSNKVNENIIVLYLSVGIAMFINVVLSNVLLSNGIYVMRGSRPLLNSDITRMLTIDAISISVISFIAFKIFKKVLKTIG